MASLTVSRIQHMPHAPHHLTHHRRSCGFTWVELLITLAILGTLVSLAAPGLRALLVQRAVSTQASALADALRLTRAEAVKRHQRVTICNTPNADDPTPVCASASTNWSTGWLIFADANGNKVREAHEALLHLQQALTPTVDLNLPHSKPAITFGGQGLAVANNASFVVQTAWPGATTPGPATTPSPQRCVRLAVSGRVRVLHGAC